MGAAIPTLFLACIVGIIAGYHGLRLRAWGMRA
jgi:hypothetical protein